VQCCHGAIIRLQAVWRHRQSCTREAACKPAVECYGRWRQTPTDAREQNNTPPTLCVGGPITRRRQLLLWHTCLDSIIVYTSLCMPTLCPHKRVDSHTSLLDHTKSGDSIKQPSFIEIIVTWPPYRVQSSGCVCLSVCPLTDLKTLPNFTKFSVNVTNGCDWSCSNENAICYPLPSSGRRHVST